MELDDHAGDAPAARSLPPWMGRRLRDAGLAWDPAPGDRFVVPDRDLDDQVFWIADMTVDVNEGPAGRFIAFNGTVEWALDSIMTREVVWLPRDDQLRTWLGPRFRSLERTPDGYRCTFLLGGERVAVTAPEPSLAYAESVLQVLAATVEPPIRLPND